MSKLTRWLTLWENWMERRRQRRLLASLDARSLHDLGLDPDRVSREIEKPFWQA